MRSDLTTVAVVTHRDVAPWKRDGFERTLLRRPAVTAVFHGTRQLQVTFRCSTEEALAVLDDVAAVTRFPVTDVRCEERPAGTDGQV